MSFTFWKYILNSKFFVYPYVQYKVLGNERRRISESAVQRQGKFVYEFLKMHAAHNSDFLSDLREEEEVVHQKKATICN